MSLTPRNRLLNYAGLRLNGDIGPLTTYHNKRRSLIIYVARRRAKALSPKQRYQLIRLQTAAHAWSRLTPHKRNQYRLAAARARLACSGYALFIATQLKPDPKALATLARLTRTELP